ncbi:ABC transporter permease [Paralcaligenes ureilyticus]|uniref:Peptide/nickel transport system permease protein n=1 Tax=Paralcaligenes ureilyticus TaxID=627131 RepID=A0A4R3LPV2_9BURK|nr:ABC transporter permease [Paralcaligenes ureilyticus]TCT00535.1 peptide/nickel transport system permease protein [Paralcaligenes ureilyticus]
MNDMLRRFFRHRPAVVGLLLLMAVLGAAMFAPTLYPTNPFALVGKPFQAPGGEYLFGTDMLGRDVLAGVLYGARTTLLIGLVATLIATFVGVSVGGLAGYFGGNIDAVLMRLTEMFQTIPFFLFAILLVAVLTPTIQSVVMAVAIVSWPPMARLVRGEFITMRNREFTQACVSMGMGHARIIFVHILPNTLSSIIVTGSLMVATAILTESGLSFLGLSDANTMSWGFIIGSGRSVLRTAWWVCAFPGIAIMLTVMAINLVGDGLNDALNPRLRTL